SRLALVGRQPSDEVVTIIRIRYILDCLARFVDLLLYRRKCRAALVVTTPKRVAARQARIGDRQVSVSEFRNLVQKRHHMAARRHLRFPPLGWFLLVEIDRFAIDQNCQCALTICAIQNRRTFDGKAYTILARPGLVEST